MQTTEILVRQNRTSQRTVRTVVTNTEVNDQLECEINQRGLRMTLLVAIRGTGDERVGEHSILSMKAVLGALWEVTGAGLVGVSPATPRRGDRVESVTDCAKTSKRLQSFE